MTTRFFLRGDTAANWTSVNPILALREPGIETDTHKMKFGDGATAWTALPYATLPVLSGATASLGGSLMTVGQRITAAATITGVAAGMVAVCNPVTDPGAGFVWHCYVSGTNTVTVCVTCVAAGTPTASVYNVRVIA